MVGGEKIKWREEWSPRDGLDHTANGPRLVGPLVLAVATEKQALQGSCVITKELASGSTAGT